MTADEIERVESAIDAMEAGEMVIILDAEDRENEGDLCFPADAVTADKINFMAKHGRGLICLAMTGERLDKLDIPMMVEQDDNASQFATAFTVSIEAREGVSTGISASDRARTVEVAVDEETQPDDIVTPGHVFPLRAREGGVLVRTGQTEASIDLARLAGRKPAAVICEIMNPDGSMARRDDLIEFGDEHDLPVVSVSEIIHHRLRNESLVECIDDEPLETEFSGDWRVQVYRDKVSRTEHLAFVCGDPQPNQPALVRVQHRCDTFDLFTKQGSNTRSALLSRAVGTIAEEGCGAVVYLDHDGKSASELVEHYVRKGNERPYRPDRTDVNQPKEELKVVGVGAQIMRAVGLGKMKLMTNRPKKALGLEGYDLEIVDQVPIPESPGGHDGSGDDSDWETSRKETA
jgi:3,4-dihydroxy 2-butanone 4-phosphate synthase/GTP cyclohydrolase II